MHSDLTFNIRYINDRQRIVQDGGLKPQSSVMVFLLSETGVMRLFTREDYQQFFKRLCLLHKLANIPENFFLKDCLLEFSIADSIGRYKLKVQDVVDLLGTSFSPEPKKPQSFEEWLSHIDQHLKNAVMLSAMTGYELFREYGGVQKYGSKEYPGLKFDMSEVKANITEKDIEHAEEISQIIMREIPDKVFKDWEKKFPDAVKSFDRAVNPDVIPYDYDKLPAAIRKKIEKHFSQFADDAAFKYVKDFGKKLTHLAWLFANDLMKGDKIGRQTFYLPRPGYKINIDEFELEDGGINLEETRKIYKLDELFPLLQVETKAKGKK
jgi:hypothetical protein